VSGRRVRFTEYLKGRSVAAQNKKPGTEVRGGARPVATPEALHTVSEFLADRAAAPSPFGDDQTFPLPADRLTYIPSTRA
jgi:hypothetical protein